VRYARDFAFLSFAHHPMNHPPRNQIWCIINNRIVLYEHSNFPRRFLQLALKFMLRLPPSKVLVKFLKVQFVYSQLKRNINLIKYEIAMIAYKSLARSAKITGKEWSAWSLDVRGGRKTQQRNKKHRQSAESRAMFSISGAS
jgi:hypothetical protein